MLTMCRVLGLITKRCRNFAGLSECMGNGRGGIERRRKREGRRGEGEEQEEEEKEEGEQEEKEAEEAEEV